MSNSINKILNLVKEGFKVEFSSDGFNMMKVGLIKTEDKKIKMEQIVPMDHHFTDGDRLDGLLDYMRTEVLKLEAEAETKKSKRTKQDWLQEFDDCIEKCKWFIEGRGFDYERLMELRKSESTAEIVKELNNIWFHLPDSFNVANKEVMKKGWGEFLKLMEFSDREEQIRICE